MVLGTNWKGQPSTTENVTIRLVLSAQQQCYFCGFGRGLWTRVVRPAFQAIVFFRDNAFTYVASTTERKYRREREPGVNREDGVETYMVKADVECAATAACAALENRVII
jgi:hypothetical protein